jgi:putative GTP pyrophosphokinase
MIFEQVVTDLDELDRPTRELFKSLDEIYKLRVIPQTERARINVRIIEALSEFLGNSIAKDVVELLDQKPFIVDRIRERAASQHMFRQPSILLAYLGVQKAPTATRTAWPITEDDLRQVFVDLGKVTNNF